MGDSENEEFESADEDFEEKKKNDVDHKAKSTKSKEDNDEKPKSPPKEKEESPPIEETKPEVIDEQPDDGWDIDDWAIEDEELANIATTKVEPKKVEFKPREVKDVADVEAELVNASIKTESLVEHSNEQPKSSNQSWDSWGSWGASFLSTASKSVATITTNISQVIESGIGVPTPETMAKLQAEQAEKMKQDGYIKDDEPITEPVNVFPFGHIVSGVTQISSKVISSGLDTLEGIGKKTMTILQENDPGLLGKRNLFTENNGPVLSQILREAKEKTEEREKSLKQIQKHEYKKKLHFETLFDDYHGLVHLEALEMLSKQATLKLESLLNSLTGKALQEVQETMNEVKELCELPENDHDDVDGSHSVEELEQKFTESIQDLDEMVIDFSDILNCWKSNLEWLVKNENVESKAIYEKAMHALAQTTALCVLRMHKLAEILLILDHHSTANEADALVQLTTLFCWHLSGLASRYSAALSSLPGDEDSNQLITNIFLEGSNSTSYIQNAFQLFIPILQIGAA